MGKKDECSELIECYAKQLFRESCQVVQVFTLAHRSTAGSLTKLRGSHRRKFNICRMPTQHLHITIQGVISCIKGLVHYITSSGNHDNSSRQRSIVRYYNNKPLCWTNGQIQGKLTSSN